MFESRPELRSVAQHSVLRRHDRSSYPHEGRVSADAVRATRSRTLRPPVGAARGRVHAPEPPGFYGDAFVRVLVEDTTSAAASPRPTRSAARAADRRLHEHDQPRVLARDGPAARELALQGRHAARRAPTASATALAAGARARTTASSTRHHPTTTKGGAHVVPEASRHAPRAAVGAAAGPGSELGRRLRLGGGRCGRGCAASSCSARRAARYYASEWTLTRENAQAVEECVREDGPRAVAEIVRVSSARAARRRTTRRCSRSRSRRASATWRRGGRRSTALPQVAPHGHAPVPVRAVRRGLPRLGPLAAARGRPLVRGAAGRTRSPTRRSSTASGRA